MMELQTGLLGFGQKKCRLKRFCALLTFERPGLNKNEEEERENPIFVTLSSGLRQMWLIFIVIVSHVTALSQREPRR